MISIEDIRTIVALALGRRSVNDADRLVEDLGAESMDLVGMLGIVEDRFSITLDEGDLLEVVSVRDLFEEVSRHSKGPV